MSRDYRYTTPVPLDSSEEYEFLCPANISIRKQNRVGSGGGAEKEHRDLIPGAGACCSLLCLFATEKVRKGPGKAEGLLKYTHEPLDAFS